MEGPAARRGRTALDHSPTLANQIGGLQRLPRMAAMRFPFRGRRLFADGFALPEPRPHSSVFPPAGSLPLAADCFITRLHLHDYVDGEIGAEHSGSALREIILDHLVLCPRCARLEHQLRLFRLRLLAVGARLTEQVEEMPSPEFRARIARLLAG